MRIVGISAPRLEAEHGFHPAIAWQDGHERHAVIRRADAEIHILGDPTFWIYLDYAWQGISWSLDLNDLVMESVGRPLCPVEKGEVFLSFEDVVRIWDDLLATYFSRLDWKLGFPPQSWFGSPYLTHFVDAGLDIDPRDERQWPVVAPRLTAEHGFQAPECQVEGSKSHCRLRRQEVELHIVRNSTVQVFVDIPMDDRSVRVPLADQVKEALGRPLAPAESGDVLLEFDSVVKIWDDLLATYFESIGWRTGLPPETWFQSP